MDIKELKECEFLLLCGFDDVSGFWQEDVDYYKQKLPKLYDYIVNGKEVKLKGKMSSLKMYLDVQQGHLLAWKSKLNTETYNALYKYVEDSNKEALSSNLDFNSTIVRGNDLVLFINDYSK